MLGVFLVLVLAVGLSLGVYLGLERLGVKAVIPAALRTVAWASLGLLLLDLSCARPPAATRPLVLLDGSLSMGTTGRWPEALTAARGLGEVRLIGSLDADSLPAGGRSEVAPAILSTAAAGRPLWLVTDGEVTDQAQVPAALWGRVGIKLFPRPPRPDLAITRVTGPERVAVGDTLRIDVDVTGFGVPDRKQVGIEVSSAATRWAVGVVSLSGGSGSATLEVRIGESIPPGPHLLSVSLRDAADSDSITDTRLLAVTVLPTPGIVLVAAPGDWEGRFLFKTITEVASLPVRGFLAVAPDRWVRMGDFGAVTAADVERATERADVLIELGERADQFKRSRARGRWHWVSSSKAAQPIEGDWYLIAGGASPVAGAFIGLPVDSFPPAVGLAVLSPGSRDFIAMSAQQNRRGVERPAVIGRDSAGRREVLVGAAGLWRWAFRGGSSEQAYRAWVASTVTWLLGGADSATGRARPVTSVVERGRPIVFERLRADSTPLKIDLEGPAGAAVDTLRFDGAGRASLALAPGRYQYRLAGGGRGLLGVERYSEELLPRPVVVVERTATVDPPAGREALRDQWWLFGLGILALSGEWWWRRRAGLR